MKHHRSRIGHRAVTIGLALVGGTLLVGCRSDLELVPVHGRVLYRGEPLAYGSIMLQPPGNGPLARGTIQSDGSFVLGTESTDDGVRPGICRVRVTAFEAQTAGMESNRQREAALGPSAIPTKYNSFGRSGLTVEISPQIQLPLVIDLE